jgi:murein DD-endopeptidase MepM/ murein hydrolase activator NlpD
MSLNEPSTKAGSKGKIYNIITILALLFLIAGIAAFIKFFEKERPQISLTEDIELLGANSTVAFSVADQKSGIREIKVLLKQGEKSASLFHKTYRQINLLTDKGPALVEEKVPVPIKSMGFDDGPAELEITCRDFSWWNWQAGNESFERYPLVIDTKPPRATLIYTPRYISPGGSGIAVYRLNEESKKHGVMIDGHFHPGFSVTQPPDGRFVAYIGLPYDMEKVENPHVIAIDKADNQGVSPFGMILKKVRYNKDKINISENFLTLKLPEFAQNYPELGGSLVEQYVYVNSEVRNKNYDVIKEVCSTSSPKQLWHDRFTRMSKSSTRSQYADHRSYYYDGKQIDKQVHLGIDLASTQRAQVSAANRGNVVFADYLGIYGNTVILDHGQGVFSLYAHLSQIDVAINDELEKNDRLGLSGTTGMAGGDHLHFSMLINGIFVNPLEWWDNQWIKINITEQL